MAKRKHYRLDSSLDITNIVICDDVRREVTGKDILIGVYNGDIVVPSFPASIRIVLWVQFEPRRAGTFHVEIRIVFPNSSHVGASFDMEIREENSPGSVAMALPIHADREGRFAVQARVNDQEWENIKNFMVKMAAPDQAAPDAIQA